MQLAPPVKWALSGGGMALLLALVMTGPTWKPQSVPSEAGSQAERNEPRKGQVIPDEALYPVPRKVRFSVTLENPRGSRTEKVAVELHAPVAETATQRTVSLNASHPYDLKTDPSGNRWLRMELAPLAPYARKILSVEADLALAKEPVEITAPLPDRYKKPGPYVQSDDPKITALAAQLRGATPRETVKRIYDWVAANIAYAGYLREDRGALYALEHRKGDCTEYMYLVLALARASGIPARGMGGYVTPNNAVLHPEDYHDWAEVYVDGRWLIVDAQKRHFDDANGQYIAMNMIEGSDSASARGRQRFLLEGEGLKITMN